MLFVPALTPSWATFQALPTTLTGAYLLLDISGFTLLTNQLQKHGTAGAESLASVLDAIFEPVLAILQHYGGEIEGFAGDAVRAFFPYHADVTAHHALFAAVRLQGWFEQNASHRTAWGEFVFDAKIVLVYGELTRQVFRAPTHSTLAQSACFFSGGELAQQAWELEAQSQVGEIHLSRAFAAQLPEGCAKLDAHGKLEQANPCPPPATPAPPYLCQPEFFPTTRFSLSQKGEFRRVVSVFLSFQPGMPIPWHALFAGLNQSDGFLCRCWQMHAADSAISCLLFWGAPTSHEHDTRNALQFLHGLRSHFAPTALRAGVNVGLVYAGFVGSALAQEYTCYGSAVNLAARLLQAANWGEILLTEEATRAVSGQFHSLPDRWLKPKGWQKPMQVWRLGELAGMRPTPAYLTAWQGRSQELRQIQDWLSPLAQHQPAGLIRIEGAAGIGKSRLLEEIRRQAGDATTWWYFFADEVQQSQPLYPLAKGLGEILQIPFQTSMEQIAPTVQAFLASYPQFEPALTPYLTALLGGTVQEPAFASLPAEIRFQNLLGGLKALFKAESQKQALVVVFEDVHWLDSESGLFLQRLLRNLQDCPIAVVCTSRVSRAFELANDLPQHILSLEMLPPAEIEQLASQLLSPSAPIRIGKRLQAMLEERANGNPFLAEQVLFYLQELNCLRVENQQVELTAQVESLPPKVQTMLVARIDRLSQRVREVVQTASIIGREFRLAILQGVFDQTRQESILPEVQNAEQAEIWWQAQNLFYLFKHSLLRDAAYAMQLHQQRRAMHRLVAETLEKSSALQLAQAAGEIAHHFEQAQVWQSARKYLQLAGDTARDAFQNESAVQFYRRWLAVPTVPDPAPAWQIQMSLGEIGLRTNQKPLTLESLQAALELATTSENLTWQAETYEQIANAQLEFSDYNQTAYAAQQARQRYVQIQHPIGVARAGVLLAMTHGYTQNIDAAIEMIQMEMERLRQLSAERDLALMQRQIAALYDAQGKSNLASEISDESLAYFQKTDDRFQIMLALHAKAQIHHHIGDLEHSVLRYEEIIRLASELGALRYQAGAQLEITGLLIQQGVVERAWQNCLSAEQIFRELGAYHQQASALNALGMLCAMRGDMLNAKHYFVQTKDIFERLNLLPALCTILANLGRLASESGDFQEAIRYSQQALSTSQKINSLIGQARALKALGIAYSAQKMYPSALESFDASIQLYEELQDNMRADAWLKKGETLLAMGDFATAKQMTQKAIDLAEQYKFFQVLPSAQIAHALVLAGLGDVTTARNHLLEYSQLPDFSPEEVWYALWRVSGEKEHALQAQSALHPLVADNPAPKWLYRKNLAEIEAFLANAV
ncbi:MAG TPA: tetratricopeptide repeat protein [Anaerolineales bacterium]|nr:tetratricopeptide repeat protein [Anaerolineales bacterium]